MLPEAPKCSSFPQTFHSFTNLWRLKFKVKTFTVIQQDWFITEEPFPSTASDQAMAMDYPRTEEMGLGTRVGVSTILGGTIRKADQSQEYWIGVK